MSTVKTNLLALFIVLLLGAACTGTDSGNDRAPESDPESSLAVVSSSNDACLFGYEDRLDQLLDRETIQEIYPLPAEANFEYSKVMRGYHQAEFTWPSERTKKITIGKRTLDAPMSNKIGIGNLKRYKEDQDAMKLFKSSYRTLSEEEKVRARQDIDREMDEYETKKGEKLSESQKDAGKGLAGAFMDAIHYETVEGVGDAAAWEQSEQALMVLVGKTQFRILADVSADTGENLKLAKTLATQVLAKCR